MFAQSRTLAPARWFRTLLALDRATSGAADHAEVGPIIHCKLLPSLLAQKLAQPARTTTAVASASHRCLFLKFIQHRMQWIWGFLCRLALTPQQGAAVQRRPTKRKRCHERSEYSGSQPSRRHHDHPDRHGHRSVSRNPKRTVVTMSSVEMDAVASEGVFQCYVRP